MHTALQILRTIWQSNAGLDRLMYVWHALIWQIRKRLGLRFVARLSNGAKIMVHPSSAFSGMFYERWIERKDMLFLRRYSNLAPTFVDVGANVGLFSASLFDAFERFYLFEPAASSFAALERTLSLNASVSATAFNLGLADQPGSLYFLDEGNCSTTSRVTAEAGRQSVVVAIDTLDNVLPPDAGPFVLKVDVEGLEERVFQGAAQHFRSRRPRLVLFERLGRSNLERLQAFFDEYGYLLFYVDDEGRPTRDPAWVSRPGINLFACPAEEFSNLSDVAERDSIDNGLGRSRAKPTGDRTA